VGVDELVVIRKRDGVWRVADGAGRVVGEFGEFGEALGFVRSRMKLFDLLASRRPRRAHLDTVVEPVRLVDVSDSPATIGRT